MSHPEPLMEPGWYDDPEGVHAHQAYWDGEKWTGRVRPDPKLHWTSIVSLAFGTLAFIGSLPWWTMMFGLTSPSDLVLGFSALVGVGAGLVAGGFFFVGRLRRTEPGSWNRRLLTAGLLLGLVGAAPPFLFLGAVFNASNN